MTSLLDTAGRRRLPAVPLASVQGTLALDLAPRYDPPPLPGRSPGRPGGDVVPIDSGRRASTTVMLSIVRPSL